MAGRPIGEARQQMSEGSMRSGVMSVGSPSLGIEALGGAINGIGRQLRRDTQQIIRSIPEAFVNTARRFHVGGITVLHAEKGGEQPAVTPQQLQEAAKNAIEKASTMKPGEQVTTTVHEGEVYVTKTSDDKDKPKKK